MEEYLLYYQSAGVSPDYNLRISWLCLYHLTYDAGVGKDQVYCCSSFSTVYVDLYSFIYQWIGLCMGQ